jgi:glycine oxidase
VRIGIAGAGLLGRLLALQLAQAGHAVEVFDPAPDALARGAAGWTAAGMLSPVAELECANAEVFAWGLRSLALWPAIANSMGIPQAMAQRGSLLLAHRGDEGAARRVVELLQRKAPATHVPQVLDMPQLHALEPAVRGPAHGWMLPEEGHIDTVQAMAALAHTANRLGVCWHWGRTVSALDPGSLQTDQGSRRFDHVFDVRGCGTRAPQGDQPTPMAAGPVRGVRGEILWLHAPGVKLHRPLRLLHPRHRVYLVPRADDRIVVGASEIESEDRSPISLRSTVELLAAAHSVIPALAEARVVFTETNLRPALPDNLPHIAQRAGLTRINGLFRHGWLIAPAMVEQALAQLGIPGHADIPVVPVTSVTSVTTMTPCTSAPA